MSNSNITTFNWDKFPVEEDKFLICICLKSEQTNVEKIDSNNIINYIKIIFPEENIIYNNNSDIINYTKKLNTTSKCTLIIDELSKNHWSQNISVLKKYLDNRGYIIIIKDYDNMPKLLLSISDIIIFDIDETANKYLTERHRMNISNFNNDSHHILIDKRNLNMNIHGLSKDEIKHYM
jgi:hypothetical protein